MRKYGKQSMLASKLISLLMTFVVVFFASYSFDRSLNAKAQSSEAVIKQQMEAIKQLLQNHNITYFTADNEACSHPASEGCPDCQLYSIMPNVPSPLYSGPQVYATYKWSAGTCVAFARWMFYNLFEDYPDKAGETVSISNAQAGDYVSLQYGPNKSHAGIFYEWADSSHTTFYLYDGNHSMDCKIHYADLKQNISNVVSVKRSTKNVRLIDKCKLDVSYKGFGTVTGTPSGRYQKDDTITLTAIPNDKSNFKSWTLTGVTVADTSKATISFSMPSNDVTVVANFTTKVGSINGGWGTPVVIPDRENATISAEFVLEAGSLALFSELSDLRLMVSTIPLSDLPLSVFNLSQLTSQVYSKTLTIPDAKLEVKGLSTRKTYNITTNLSELNSITNGKLIVNSDTTYYYILTGKVGDTVYKTAVGSFTTRKPLVTWSDLCTNGGKYSGLFNGVVRWDKSLSMYEVGCFVSTDRNAVVGASRSNHNGCAHKNDTSVQTDASVTTDAAYGTWVFYNGPSFDTISSFTPGTTYYYKFYAYTSDGVETCSDIATYTPAGAAPSSGTPVITWSDLCTNGGKYNGLFNGVVRWDKSLTMHEVGCFVSTDRNAVAGASRTNHNGCAHKNDTVVKMDASVTTDAANGTWVFYKGPSFDTISSFAAGTTYYYKFYAYTSNGAETFSEIAAYTPGGATTPTTDVTSGVKNIVNRAYQQVDLEWTPLKNVSGWNDYLFQANITYTGVPYGQPYTSNTYLYYPISLETFLSAVADENSVFYTARSAGRQPSVYYCNDCSAFVSYCYNLSSRQTTSSLAALSSMTQIASLSSAEIGDCLDKTDSHVVLITNIYSSNGVTYYEICEQTPPKARKKIYTATEIQNKYINNGYLIFRYNYRDSVPAPGSVNRYGYLDVNGCIDGTDQGTLGAFGTFNITVGNVSKTSVNDYYDGHNAGTRYTITNVKANDGYDYLGVKSGNLSGSVLDGNTVKVVLNFATQGNLHVQGNLDGVVSESIADYGTFDVYINGTQAATNVSIFNQKYPNGTKYEIKNIKVSEGKMYNGLTSFTGTISSDTESNVALFYTSTGTATPDWQVGKAVPGNLDRDMLDVEYKHTYTQQGRTAPGNDWTLLQEGPVQYENVGGQYESDNELPTSATRVQIGYYYYHYCNNGELANYYWKDYLPVRHAIPMANSMNNFTAEEKGTDGDGSGRKYYYLTHTQGQYSGAIARCSSSGSKIYYRGYVYQDKAEYRINTYQKVGEWTTTYDSSASSVSVRWRLKEGVATDYKGLQLNFVVDGNSVASLEGVAGLDVYINGEKKADNSTTFKAFFPGEFAYEIQLRNIADDKLYKQIEGGELNGVVTEALKTLTLYFVTGVEAGANWKEIPANLLPYLDDSTEVEYRHTYKQNARTSPGEGWEMIEQGAVQYEDDGPQYESDNELETSATRVLVGYYYFHWCNDGETANYYQKDYLPIKHTVPMSQINTVYSVQEKGTDGDGSGRKYYHLIWLSGQWAGGAASCGDPGSRIWYRGGIYQNKKAYQINTYQKVSDWSTELDPTATLVEYRIRKKQYSVSFDAGAGTFDIEYLYKNAGEDLMLPSAVPVRDLYEFIGWNTAYDGTGKTYLPGAVYDKDESIVLYANWREQASMELPNALRTIDEEAFAGINAVIFRIPPTCKEIKSRAFLNCSNLRRIYISSSTSQISVDAFDGCVNLVICAPAGSTAIKVAKYNDIPYIEMDSIE